MARSYPYSIIFRKVYDSKKNYFKELRAKLKEYMLEDYRIALELGVDNADELYRCLEDELKAPMSKTRSGIYLLAKEITEPRCFIEELEKQRELENKSVETIVYDWINYTYQVNYVWPAMKDLETMLMGDMNNE